MKRLLANPVLFTELRRRMRSNRTLAMFVVYLSLISGITMLIYWAFVTSMDFTITIQDGREIGKTIFITVIFSALVQVCIITPSLTSGSIAGEKERQTYDLLITTLLSPWHVVIGKLGSAIAYALLLIIATLPLAGLSFVFGGVSGEELVVAMVSLLATAILFAAIGMFWSVVVHTTLGATVRALATIILLLLGVPFLFFIASVADLSFINDLLDIPFFVYIFEIILCSHPFIALILSEIALIEGKELFFFTITPNTTEVLLPAPWLVFVCVSSVVTIGLLVMSVQLLQPVQYKPKQTQQKMA